MTRILFAALALAAASHSHAYCVYNETDREATVIQEHHPNPSRDARRLNRTLAPKSHVCCYNLDCNPEGRENSVVRLEVRILGEQPYICGFPQGVASDLKVTGAGTIRILANRRKSPFPYVVRIRTHDRKDLTGPHGVACTEPKSQEKGIR